MIYRLFICSVESALTRLTTRHHAALSLRALGAPKARWWESTARLRRRVNDAVEGRYANPRRAA